MSECFPMRRNGMRFIAEIRPGSFIAVAQDAGDVIVIHPEEPPYLLKPDGAKVAIEPFVPENAGIHPPSVQNATK